VEQAADLLALHGRPKYVHERPRRRHGRPRRRQQRLPHGVTASLATAAAPRAFGSAAAALAPRIISEASEAGISGLRVALVTVLLATMVITLAWHRSQSSLPRTGPAAHPG
jgi:hypothetical protein